MIFYSLKNNLAELFKILSDDGDNSLLITMTGEAAYTLNP